MKILVFYVPCSDRESATKLVNELISRRLIACGNIIESNSLYQWKNELCSETEYVAIMKTTTEKEVQVENNIEQLHTYDVPCIARWPIEVNDSYGKWVIGEVTS